MFFLALKYPKKLIVKVKIAILGEWSNFSHSEQLCIGKWTREQRRNIGIYCSILHEFKRIILKRYTIPKCWKHFLHERILGSLLDLCQQCYLNHIITKQLTLNYNHIILHVATWILRVLIDEYSLVY